jgi:hypothetical protein
MGQEVVVDDQWYRVPEALPNGGKDGIADLV